MLARAEEIFDEMAGADSKVRALRAQAMVCFAWPRGDARMVSSDLLVRFFPLFFS
eukprot:SAG11_NODE_1498_length_4791_cov_3.641517_3_plen_55_part_00